MKPSSYLIFILALLVTLTWGYARAADEYEIGTLLGSDHWMSGDYNEDQWPSLYLGWRHGDIGGVVGFYDNSEYNDSYFAAYVSRYSERVTVLFGGATGYDAAPVIPFVGVQISLGPARIFAIPGVTAWGLGHRF